jgi:hypothetical protein
VLENLESQALEAFVILACAHAAADEAQHF